MGQYLYPFDRVLFNDKDLIFRQFARFIEDYFIGTDVAFVSLNGTKVPFGTVVTPKPAL